MVLYIYIMASVLCVPGTQVVRNRTVVGLAENLIAVSNDYATHLDGGCVAFVVKARFPSFFTLVSRYYFVRFHFLLLVLCVAVCSRWFHSSSKFAFYQDFTIRHAFAPTCQIGRSME